MLKHNKLNRHISKMMEYGLDKMQLRRAPSLPKQIHLSVTDRCFLPCLHCDIWKNKATDLGTEIWLNAIHQLGKWCAPASMNFVGGEPLLRQDLEILLGAAKDWGFETSFNTNGWLVTKERAQSISKTQVNSIYVSLDGMRPETVDHSRGREGSFDKAMQAINYFREAGSKVVIAGIIHAHNALEILDLLDWVESNNMELVLQPLYDNFGNRPYNPDWWKTSELFPKTPEEQRVLQNVLQELAKGKVQGRPLSNHPKQFLAMQHHFQNPNQDIGISCRAGHHDLAFDPQGNIRLCYFLEPVGNLFQNPNIEDLWYAKQTLRLRWEVSRCSRNCSLLNCNFDAAS